MAEDPFAAGFLSEVGVGLGGEDAGLGVGAGGVQAIVGLLGAGTGRHGFFYLL